MSKTQAKKIVKEYAKKLKEEKYSFRAIYLFGSMAKGKTHKWSDIDVAVVSSKLKRNYFKNKVLLWKLKEDVDDRIEPHGFTPEDFKVDENPMVWEIKQTGIRIA